MANIIISYRRLDSAAIAGRIRDRLAQYYGADAIFMDIDSIPFGIDFRQHIQEAVAKNGIVLALIGPKWIGAKKGGTSRINDDKDAIRIEIETALNQGIPLIPVLVGGATMPKSSALPESLQKLCFLNAAEVDNGRDFHQHVDRLIRAMDRLLTETKLSGLAQKAESGAIRSIAASLPKRDEPVAPREQPLDKGDVQEAFNSKGGTAFSSFFCEQTITMARFTLVLAFAAWIVLGTADVGREMQTPILLVYRGTIAVPILVVAFAASYSRLAQLYWQTFLSIMSVLNGLAIFFGALLSYKTEPTFDVNKFVTLAMMAPAAGALLPVRFLNAAGICAFGLGLFYLLLFWTGQPFLPTLWMQLAFIFVLCVFCAAAYFREQLLWALFQSIEAGRLARAGSTK
jgi:TIR domain